MKRFLELTLALTFCVLAFIGCAPDETPLGPASGEEISAPAFALAPNSWTARAPLPTGRQELDAAVVNNGAGEPILYVLGGWDVLDQPVSRVEAYNYSTNRWTTKAASGAGQESNGVGVIGGKLYISGGVTEHGDGLEIDKTLVTYDPVRDVFSSKANMPRTSANGVSGVIRGRLYVLTGQCGPDCAHSLTRRLYRYDPATNAWNASLPWCPNAHVRGAGGVINGKFYVAGGVHANGVTSARLDVYDPATNSWKALAPMPSAVVGAAGAVIKNKLYVMGGNVGKAVYSYDPVTNRWTARAPMLTGRRNLAAASLITPSGNPKILAVGGIGSDERGYRANELYTP
jgi:N-acetylneuraminic acid mutarotase